jgi:hypothetical protein
LSVCLNLNLNRLMMSLSGHRGRHDRRRDGILRDHHRADQKNDEVRRHGYVQMKCGRVNDLLQYLLVLVRSERSVLLVVVNFP